MSDPHPRNPCNCVKSTLALAEAVCAESGARLTPIRRRVLELVAEAQAPVGAYWLIDQLFDKDGSRPAPITVYRALDFLMERSLVHRIASKNAYLACNHSHHSGETVVFLICERCGVVTELTDPRVGSTIADAAKGANFTPRQPVLEIGGTCAACVAEG